MLLHVPLGAEAGVSKRKKSKAEQRPAKVALGALVTATVTSVHATQAALQMESGAPALAELTGTFVTSRYQGSIALCFWASGKVVVGVRAASALRGAAAVYCGHEPGMNGCLGE